MALKIHCCLFDFRCWKGAWRYAMPLRLHIGSWMFTLVNQNRRSRRQWDEAWESGLVWRRDAETGRMQNIHGEDFEAPC